MLKEFYEKIYAEWKRKIIENAKTNQKLKAIREVPIILARFF